MTSEMGEMWNEIRRERKEKRAKRRDEFAPGPEWVKHHETHYSRDLLGEKLEYWPGTTRFRWKGRSYHGNVMNFITKREKGSK